jgi:hypothetical protein
MKHLSIVILAALAVQPAMADTSVGGYFRNNGTYIAPHYRSSPDSNRNNNYGRSSSRGGYQSQQRYLRDQDNYGLFNQYDLDDDNDGTFDQDE